MQANSNFSQKLELLINKTIDCLPGDRRLARKLIAIILLINGVASVIVTTITILIDYKYEVNRISEVVDLIKKSNIKSIAVAVWNYDEKLIELQAEGMLQYKYLRAVRLIDPDGMVKTFGVDEVPNSLSYRIPLPAVSTVNLNSIGNIEVIFSATELYFDLAKKFALVLFTQFIKALLVSLVFFYIFRIYLIRPILVAAKNAKAFDAELFNYLPIPIKDNGNELDELFASVNALSEKNIYSHHQISRVNEDLEAILAERTAVIQKQEKALADEARLASLGRVAGGIAHEINTPLSAAVIKLGVLKGKAANENLPAMAESIDKVTQILGRISQIINNMRSLNRDTSIELITDVGIEPIISQTIGICSEVIKHKNIQIGFDAGLCRDIMARVRPTQFGQVLVNLFRNSIDAIEPLENKWIKITVEEESNLIRIHFSDSGLGLSEKIAKNIFDPYFTTKDQGKGNGLGLSISRKMIDAMGGKMYLKMDAPNTTFVLELPK